MTSFYLLHSRFTCAQEKSHSKVSKRQSRESSSHKHEFAICISTDENGIPMMYTKMLIEVSRVVDYG